MIKGRGSATQSTSMTSRVDFATPAAHVTHQQQQVTGPPASPTLRVPHGPLVVRAGDEVTFIAEIDGNPLPQVTWYIGGKEVRPTSGGQYDVTVCGTCYALRLKSADESLNGTGVYVVAANQYGVEKRHFTVSVYKGLLCA